MCEFKSGIVLRDESLKGGFKLLMSPWTDHHSELIQIHNLHDGSRLSFARVEFKPESMATADKPDTYKLRIDEGRTPEWFDDEMKEVVSGRMRDYIRSIIITDDRCLLIGGQFILSGKVYVQVAKCCVIQAMLASSKVGEMWESSKVGEMWESSKVGEMWASSQVGTMRESSKVGTMRESSQVGTMRESSKVGTMRESSKVGEMWESSQVVEAGPDATHPKKGAK